MPRAARQMSGTGIYHVMVRGINKQDIFIEQEDYLRYLDSLVRVRARSGCHIHGYCLMSNHVHLLLQAGNEDVGQVMKRIGASYVRWYNSKYQRVGHLFQDRFLSEAVEDDTYLLTVLRYIHQNPVKAGLAADCADYPWSSYPAYISPGMRANEVTETAFVLGIYGGVPQFIKSSAVLDDGKMRLEESDPPTDEAVVALVNSLLAGQAVPTVGMMKKVERDNIIGRLKALGGVTNGQIARLTGLTLSAVQRAATESE